jgi:hypothetical protein
MVEPLQSVVMTSLEDLGGGDTYECHTERRRVGQAGKRRSVPNIANIAESGLDTAAHLGNFPVLYLERNLEAIDKVPWWKCGVALIYT